MASTEPSPKPKKKPPSKQRSAKKLSRDTILFVVGLLGIGHETLISHADRPTLLIGFFAMCGLPAFLHGDEVSIMRKSRPAEDDDSEGSEDDS